MDDSNPLQEQGNRGITIPLTGRHGQGKAAKVSPEDAEQLRHHKWYMASTGYAYAYIDQRYTLMHRFILGAKKGQAVDHSNHDRLDNRRENIRLCSYRQNGWNRNKEAARATSSRFKGVHWEKSMDKWCARIKVGTESFHLGGYDDEARAARVYDQAARYHFGAHCQTNFPGTAARSAHDIRNGLASAAREHHTSAYKGVHWHKKQKKWASILYANAQKIWLGTFEDETDAAHAYDDARAAHGLARVNFT